MKQEPTIFVFVQSVVWGGCDPSVVQDSALSCGFLEVPLDYHDASVGKGRFALARVNATADPGAQPGTLLFNPGKFSFSRAYLIILTSALSQVIPISQASKA